VSTSRENSKVRRITDLAGCGDKISYVCCRYDRVFVTDQMAMRYTEWQECTG
jgi:hypothetical protein